MSYFGDFGLGSTLFFRFTTVNSSGAPVALTSAGITAYRAGSTVQDATGLTLTSTFDTIVGLNSVQVDMSTAGFYSSAGDYTVIISSGAGSESLAGYVLGSFSILKRSALTSTAGLETLSSAGLETLSSAGLETLSSAGLETLSSAGLETLSTAGLETISSAVVIASASSALQAINLDHLLSSSGSSDQVADDSLWTKLVSSSTSYTDFKSTLDSLSALRVRGDAAWATLSTAGLETLSSAGLETLSTAGLETLSSAGLETLSSAGLETASSLVTVATISTAAAIEINTEVLDVVNTDTHEEPSFGTPTTAPTFVFMSRLIYSALRNQIIVSASAKNFYGQGGNVLWGKVLSQDTTGSTGIYTEAGGSTST